MQPSTSLFTAPERAKQLISFTNLQWGKNNRPTDIDALFEYHNILYIVVELKYRGNDLPFGQNLALTRLVDDLSLRKPSMLVVATHETPLEQEIDLAAANVERVRLHGKWRLPRNPVTVRKVMDTFIAETERTRRRI